VTIIGIGIGVAVAIAVGCVGMQKPIATAIATPIPIPTDRVFSSLFDAAKFQPTYELVGNSWLSGCFLSRNSHLGGVKLRMGVARLDYVPLTFQSGICRIRLKSRSSPGVQIRQ
jgi:hypothetical protein